MRNAVIIGALVVVLALAGTGYLAWVQNSARVSQLSLDLGFAAWELRQPLPVLGLMGVSFLTGLVGGVVGMGVRAMFGGSRSAAPPRRTAPDAPRPY